VADLALERKALDVVVIDLRTRSSYADFLVIASGTSDRHVQAIVEHIDESLAKSGTQAIGTEGLREGQWALADFGSVVVHVFHEYTRQVYDLEAIWRDAPRLSVANDQAAVPATH
jgi:ribosome-associated protein